MTYGPKPKPPEERFWPKVDAFGDCWEYTGFCTAAGYGLFHVTGKRQMMAHRFAWQTLVGPIPEGMELDHLCRNPRCVNPDHLEPVTQVENNRRAYGLLRRQALRTHCPRGHAYDIMVQTSRWCSTCRTAANRVAYLKRRGLPPDSDVPIQPLPGLRTHCPQGHEYNAENTYVSPQGARHCRTCERDRKARKRADFCTLRLGNMEAAA